MRHSGMVYCTYSVGAITQHGGCIENAEHHVVRPLHVQAAEAGLVLTCHSHGPVVKCASAVKSRVLTRVWSMGHMAQSDMLLVSLFCLLLFLVAATARSFSSMLSITHSGSWTSHSWSSAKPCSSCWRPCTVCAYKTGQLHADESKMTLCIMAAVYQGATLACSITCKNTRVTLSHCNTDVCDTC